MKVTETIAETIVLRDDATEMGGASYNGETLDHFMKEIGIPFGTDIDEINNALVECGIEPIV